MHTTAQGETDNLINFSYSYIPLSAEKECIFIKRFDSIDILRTVAIIGMIQVHFTEILSSYYGGSSLLFNISDLIGSFPAPLFTFLVGMSLFISVKRQEISGLQPGAIADRNLRRGMALFFLGLLFATLIWTPAEVFGWDILTLIGASLLIVFPLRKLNNGILTAIILLIVAVSPLLRIWSDYPSYWNRWGEYITSSDLKGALLGFVLNGYFPLLPWLIFPLCGYLVGRACFADELPRLPKSLLPLGFGLVLLSAGLLLVGGYIAPFTFYPASTSFLAMALGITLILFVLAFRLFDLQTEKPINNWFLTFSRRFSRYALTAYVVHHAVLVWPILFAANYTGKQDHWFYYGEVVPTAYALALSLLFILLFYGLIVLWDKCEGRYSFEWLLRRLTG
jgi:uncharacterized membrane protein